MREIAAIGFIFEAAHSLVYADFFLLLPKTSCRGNTACEACWTWILSISPPIIQRSRAVFGSMIWVFCVSLTSLHPILLSPIPLPYFSSSPEFALDIWINVSSSAAVVACLSESPLLHCTHHKHWLPPLAPGPSLLFSTGRFCYYLPRLLGFLFTRWHGHALTLISKCEINFDEVLKICLQMVLSVLRLKLP